MMTKDMFRIYWMTNKKWYKVVNGEFQLTSEAPPEARRSFEEWHKPRKMGFKRFLRRLRTLFY